MRDKGLRKNKGDASGDLDESENEFQWIRAIIRTKKLWSITTTELSRCAGECMYVRWLVDGWIRCRCKVYERRYVKNEDEE